MESIAGLYALASLFIAVYQGSQGNFIWVPILSVVTSFTYPYWYIGMMGQRHTLFGLLVMFMVLYPLLYLVGTIFS